jgi:hypothetical protein
MLVMFTYVRVMREREFCSIVAEDFVLQGYDAA